MNRAFYLHSIQGYMESQSESRPRTNNKRRNYFEELDDLEFSKRFRLTKSTCRFLLTKIGSSIQSNSNRQCILSAETKLLAALRFYASGSFLITVGDFCGMSVTSASRAVKEVSCAIASLASSYIKFGDHEQTIRDFFQIAKFPKVVGAIDCTHVRIQSPGGENAEIFRNRKGYFSLNVQAVCNAQLLFEDIVARWPGSSHDSNIFNNSRLKFRLDNGEFENFYILGDSGYKLSKYLLTPLLNPITENEKLYNESQIRTRNVVERCFGVWKRRFPVLSMGMRIKLDTVKAVIVACAVLHNIAILQKDPLPPGEYAIFPQESIYDTESVSSNDTQNNSDARARNVLIENYFSRL